MTEAGADYVLIEPDGAALSQPDSSGVSAFAILSRYRWLVAATVLAALVVASIYLRNVTYRYSAELKVTVAAAQRPTFSSSQAGLAALAGINLQGAGNGSPIALYLETLHSRDVADEIARDPATLHHLFAEQWDPVARRWHEPTGIAADLLATGKAIFGIPVRPWHPPAGEAVQRYLNRVLVAYENAKSGVTTVAVSDRDPQFAAALLGRLDKSADAHLRARALRRASDYIAYIEAKLPRVTIAEQRQSLVNALSEQEKQQMTASAGAAFAAEPLGAIASSDRPTSPDPAVTIGGATIVGLALGVALAFARDAARRRRAPA